MSAFDPLRTFAGAESEKRLTRLYRPQILALLALEDR